MALCIHAHECGGCKWQSLAYSDQVQKKQHLVEELFKTTGCPVSPIIACENPWHYRNKMEFSFSQNKKGERFLGLILAGSKGRVFNVHACHIMNTWVAGLLSSVRSWWEKSGLEAYFMPRDVGTLRTLIVREGKRTGHIMLMLTVSGNPAFACTQKQLDTFVQCIQEALGPQPHLSIFLRIQQQIKGSPTQFFEMHLAGPDYIHERLSIGGKSFTFKISPTSFFQPNSVQAEVLYGKALSLIKDKKQLVYDLYCGTGTLGMALASQAERVVGIELNPHALFDAGVNAEMNAVTNMEFICGDVGEKLALLGGKPDLVIIDPPRPGLSAQALAHVLTCQPQEILYISCNPVTQAENVQILLQKGYVLVHLQPVDQFPHTPHIENIALLRSTFS